MPRMRNPENRGLPARWRLVHGAYYYQVPAGKEAVWDNKKLFRLGKSLPVAYKIWAERLESAAEVRTIGQLLDRYALEVLPTKAAATRAGDTKHIKLLRGVFGAGALTSLRPQMIYQYADKRGSKTCARQEIALLSHTFTKAVEWGYINKHPFKGEVRLGGEKARTRYIEDWEVLECLALPSVRKRGSITAIKAYIRLKMLTGLRRGDLLRLRAVQLQDDGIHVETSKTGKPVIYQWTPSLHEAVSLARCARPVDISPYLFCNRKGQGYINEETGAASGWDSMWQRFMDRVLAETKVKERFTEHDLRAKVGSDAESLEHARQLLTHADSKTTNRIYRRKAEIVKPLR